MPQRYSGTMSMPGNPSYFVIDGRCPGHGAVEVVQIGRAVALSDRALATSMSGRGGTRTAALRTRVAAGISVEPAPIFGSPTRADAYVVSVLPDEMAADLELPTCLLCGDRLTSASPSHHRWLPWWRSLDSRFQQCFTKSVLHYDQPNIMNCLTHGPSKVWTFVDSCPPLRCGAP